MYSFAFFKDDVIEQEIIEMYMGSLKLCDTQTRRDILRQGLIYQCLGKIYASAYRKQVEKARKKKLMNLCKLYYEKSVRTKNCSLKNYYSITDLSY